MAKAFLFMKKKLGIILLSGVAITITLVLLEVFIRIFFPQQLFSLRPDIWVPDDGLGWKMAANIDTYINTGERKVHLRTDHNGHRIGENHPQGNPDFRILALGDSFLAALQVEHSQTMTARLAENLSRQFDKNIAIENTGVWAWNPNHYLIKAKRELQRSKYDLGLVFIFMGNDVVDQRQDHYTPKTAVDPYPFRMPKRISSTEFFSSFFIPLNDFFLKRSHLYNFSRNRLSFLLMRFNFSHQYFPQNLSIDSVLSSSWKITTSICCDINQLFVAEKIPVVFILLPSSYQVDEKLLKGYVKAMNSSESFFDLEQPAKLLKKEMSACNLHVVDTTTSLRNAHIAGQKDVFGEIDRHFGLRGHQIVSDFLQPVLSDILYSHNALSKK